MDESQWQVTVSIPLRHRHLYDSLFDAIADAAHEWESQQGIRDGWDVDVFGAPEPDSETGST